MQPPKPAAPKDAAATAAPKSATASPTANPTAAGAPVPRSRRLPIALAACAAMVLVCGITLWAVNREGDPLLNEDTVTLVKFVSGPRYAKLPFARQAEYMKVLEDRDDNDELEAAFDAGKLTEAEYRAGLMEAWLGQQVKRGEKFASLPPGAARERYVRELVDKKEAKDAKKAARRGKPESAKSESAPPDVKRDKAQEDIRIAAWPVDARTKWEQYKRAYDAERDAREAAAAKEGAAGG